MTVATYINLTNLILISLLSRLCELLKMRESKHLELRELYILRNSRRSISSRSEDINNLLMKSIHHDTSYLEFLAIDKESIKLVAPLHVLGIQLGASLPIEFLGR